MTGSVPHGSISPDERQRADQLVHRLQVSDPAVARAMRNVPRSWFVPPEEEASAYEDTPLPIGPAATISAPHMVAIMLEAADLRTGSNVLEAGSGSGYVLALLAEIVGPTAKVVGIEIEPELVRGARERLRRLGLGTRVRVEEGDAGEGSSSEATFDRILVSYAVEGPLPAPWTRQLRPGGLLVVPHGGPDVTYLMTYRREGDELVLQERGPPCLFVPSKSTLPRARPAGGPSRR